jgi:hypothetical protein
MPSAAARPPARLIAVNVALLMALAAVVLVNRAGAQGGSGVGGRDGSVRGRGEYTMVSGRIQGATTHTIYIIDGANQEVLALGWNRNDSRAEVIGFRSIVDDARYLQRPR